MRIEFSWQTLLAKKFWSLFFLPQQFFSSVIAYSLALNYAFTDCLSHYGTYVWLKFPVQVQDVERVVGFLSCFGLLCESKENCCYCLTNLQCQRSSGERADFRVWYRKQYRSVNRTKTQKTCSAERCSHKFTCRI